MAAFFSTLCVVSLTFVLNETIYTVELCRRKITEDASHVTATAPVSLHPCLDDTLYHSTYKCNTKRMQLRYITPEFHTD
jgi:hypothetical protein